MKCNAIILAAGYGSRLAPITDILPKPLVPVGDRTLLENILIDLDSANVAEFAINSYHMGSMIKSVITKSSWDNRILLFPESEILGTGGPIINAKKFLLECDSFILHNGDILTNLDFSTLIKHHKKTKSDVTMVMIDGPENKVAVNKQGQIIDILGKLNADDTDCQNFTYAGISIYSSKIFDYLPDNVENCSIITAILNLMRNPQNVVSAYSPDSKDFYWNDIGTIDKLLEAQKDISKKNITLKKSIISIDMPLIALPYPGASDRSFFRFNPTSGFNGKQACFFDPPDGYVATLNEAARFLIPTSNDNIGKRVVMCGGEDSEEFHRFIKVAKLLEKHNLGSPKIHQYSLERNCLIMEDLGDNLFYHILQGDISSLEKEELYKKVISWLVKFQATTYNDISKAVDDSKSDELFGVRIFDYNYLRWETQYFSDNFLAKYCNLSEYILKELENEFTMLAKEALREPQLLIHRDFQSQNIIFNSTSGVNCTPYGRASSIGKQACFFDCPSYGRASSIAHPLDVLFQLSSKLAFSIAPMVASRRNNLFPINSECEVRIVDFQGARFGHIAYDLISLLKDPYTDISEKLRSSLIDFYYSEISNSTLFNHINFSRSEFANFAITAALQRNMQALGAYAFLAYKKGKIEYLQYIPQGLKYLKSSLKQLAESDSVYKLPKLTKVISELSP